MKNIILARLKRVFAKMDIVTKCPATPFKVGDPIGDTEVVNASALKAAGNLSKNLIDYENKVDDNKLYTKQHIDTSGDLTAVQLAKAIGNEGPWKAQEADKLYAKMVEYLGGKEFKATVKDKKYDFKVSDDTNVYTKGTNANNEEAFFIKVVRTDDESTRYNCYFYFTAKVYYLGVADKATKTWTNEVYPMVDLESVQIEGKKVAAKDLVAKRDKVGQAETVGKLSKAISSKAVDNMVAKKWYTLNQKLNGAGGKKVDPVKSIRVHLAKAMGYSEDDWDKITSQEFVEFAKATNEIVQSVKRAAIAYAESLEKRAQEDSEAPLTEADKKAQSYLVSMARFNTDIGMNEDGRKGTEAPSGIDWANFAHGLKPETLEFTPEEAISAFQAATK